MPSYMTLRLYFLSSFFVITASGVAWGGDDRTTCSAEFGGEKGCFDVGKGRGGPIDQVNVDTLDREVVPLVRLSSALDPPTLKSNHASHTRLGSDREHSAFDHHIIALSDSNVESLDTPHR